jgi:hypothetical protein
VVQRYDPTDHRGQGHQDCNVYQLSVAAGSMPTMPEVVVNGPLFVRQILVGSVDHASARICHGDLTPHKSPNPVEFLHEIDR